MNPAAGANARGQFLRPFRGLEAAEAEGGSGFQGRSQLMKPLPVFPTVELNEIAMTIHREILDRDPGVTFNDIAELHGAKQLLKEAVVMPSKYPQLFSGLLRPWKGILLFGPPGTGKTMLAKAVATECRTTFFNISAASIVSKWRGDSEKTVRMLFDLAVHFAPSTVFIDELDSVLGARTSDEHEATRRMKTEFLVQMDGLAKRENGDIVFVLAASNHPWDLDSAVLRRLEKRIHVGLPSRDGREAMFRRLLPNVEPGFDFSRVAAATEGYSGADIDILCREATMRTVRVLIRQLETAEAGKLPTNAVTRPVVTVADVLESLEVTRASVNSIPTKAYHDWEQKFGSTISGDRERPAPSAISSALPVTSVALSGGAAAT
jgi:katanin p60 ATPase-containing subunit A1